MPPTATINPGNLAILVVRGLSFGPIDFILTDSNDAVINLTGYSVRWIAKTEASSPNEYDLEPTIPAPATDGKVRIDFTVNEVLTKFPVGDYIHSLVVIDGSGNASDPIEGPLTVINNPAKP